MKLLGTNAKLAKGNGGRYWLRGLALAPHRRSGVNVCPFAGACSSVCVTWFSGRTVTGLYRDAALRRSRDWIADPTGFEDRLCGELGRHETDARDKGLIPLVRLNVASDLDWRRVARCFPRTTFYDYTKVWSRCRSVLDGSWPDNYQLTYSHSERARKRCMREYLDSGRNVSIVCDLSARKRKPDPLPAMWRVDGKAYPVVDGNRHDWRITQEDGSGVVVMLRYNGPVRLLRNAIERGFVVSLAG